MTHSRAPTGLARRGRRLSDQETEQRMLSAARQMLAVSGLTVSLDHISFEDLIRAADVSRSTVYRRWPYKDLFFSDLVKDLARTATPTLLAGELALIRQIVADRADWLEAPGQRHALIVELFRQLSMLDFQALHGSPEWRTYIALHATYLSLADDELRSQVRAALTESERDHVARVAAAWELLTSLFGYRLRPETGSSFEDLAALLDATMRGLVIAAFSVPGHAEHRTRARPFGAAAEAEWSLPALGLASIASAFLEPDPDVRWDADRVAQVRHALTSLGSSE
jgi:AcrR family transcriptional regulator